MKFGVNSRANTPYPVITGVAEAAIGGKIPSHENYILAV